MILGHHYERHGQCELCHHDDARLVRRTLDGRVVASAAYFCKGCFDKVSEGQKPKYCRTCHVERESGAVVCRFCRAMKISCASS